MINRLAVEVSALRVWLSTPVATTLVTVITPFVVFRISTILRLRRVLLS